MNHTARRAENRWTSERIHAAYLVMLCDMAMRLLWPKWFRGIVGMATLRVDDPRITSESRVYTFTRLVTCRLHGCAPSYSRVEIACAEDEFKAFEGWVLAHGDFFETSYDTAQRRVVLRAQYVGKPDPKVIAWIRAQPSACANLIGRSAYPDEDGLPPMFGPPLAPAERWTITTLGGWVPTSTRMTAPPWNPLWDGLW